MWIRKIDSLLLECLKNYKKKVGTGELEVDEIPKIKTIENWITRYNQEHKKVSAAKELYFGPAESK
jgi:hypothetical protein